MADNGAPADFGGRVLPNPTGVQPEWDSEHAVRPKKYPGGAIMSVDNAPLEEQKGDISNPPLPTPAMQQSFPEQAKLSRPNKNGFDPIGDIMRHHKIPMTRENYIALNHLGENADATPEEDAEMPARFRPAYPTHEELKNQKGVKPKSTK